MVIENKLNKRKYRNLVFHELLYGKCSIAIIVLYFMAWKILYSVAKAGNLKRNLPSLLVIFFLLLLILIYILAGCHRHMKNKFIYKTGSQIYIDGSNITIDTNEPEDSASYSRDSLTRIKENKKWYFLFFDDGCFLPVSKDMSPAESNEFRNYLTACRPVKRTHKLIPALCLILITAFGIFYVGRCAQNFRGALSWKLLELKTDKKVELKENNFYKLRLSGIMALVKSKENVEPHLMTNSLDIKFENDGTITSIDTYIYGFDKDNNLKSGYLLYYDESKGNKLTIHKQDFKSGGNVKYDANNDLSIVINMLNNIPLKQETSSWNQPNLAVMYKGIRNWGGAADGIRFINKSGLISISDNIPEKIEGPTVSVYCPGKEQLITPHRFVYK